MAALNGANKVPLPGTPDLERQPLLNGHGLNGSGNGSYNTNGFGNGVGGGVGGEAQSRSHIPTALGRRPSSSEQQQRQESVRRCWRFGLFAILLALLAFLVLALFDMVTG